jgi:Uma2 family endonuclease
MGEQFVVERVRGDVHLLRRLSPVHKLAASALGALIGSTYQLGSPGGWTVVYQPELELGDDVLVPDVAAWRQTRMPLAPKNAFTIAPDWIAEVIMPDDEAQTSSKLGLYANAGVPHAWIVAPTRQTIQVMRLFDGALQRVAEYRGAERVRIEPFDAIEIELDVLWH